MKPLLTICTPSIWKRRGTAFLLNEEIKSQCEVAGLTESEIEHLTLFDNKSMTIGEKRQRLFDSARGTYVAFVDDDDAINSLYVASIANAALKSQADVITFKQRVTFDGKEGTAIFRLGQQDEPFAEGEFKRGPWHVCAWRKDLVADCKFLNCNYGEDIAWAVQARQCVRRGVFIDAVLHHYTYDPKTTEAPPEQ